MVLPNKTIYRFAKAAGQAGVHILHFGTKEIAFRPERFDDALTNTFRIINEEFPHMHLNLVTHYTHADEFLLRDDEGLMEQEGGGAGPVSGQAATQGLPPGVSSGDMSLGQAFAGFGRQLMAGMNSRDGM